MRTIKRAKKSNVRIFLLCVVMVFAMLLGGMKVNANAAAASGDRKEQTDIQKVSNELFGDISIKSSEYLYNLDESPDFIYLEFEDSGYAIFSSKTLDVLEYSLSGTLPYVAKSKKYYTGPTGYHNKVGETFKNLATGESITVSEAAVIVSQTRAVLANAQTTKGLARQNNIGNTNSVTTGISQFSTAHTSSTETKLPTKSSNSGGIQIPGGGLGSGTTYISNAEYFITGPYHGTNTTGTCSAVSAQLLLSYNNYYNDRRIIANEYLFAGNDGPNTSANPMSMTNKTLGTRGLDEDGSDDANSYFHKVVGKIPASSNSSVIVSGLNSLLSERRSELGLSANLAAVSSGTNVATIKSEIDANRPIIITMHYDNSGNHAVVGYGYQTLGGSGTEEDGQFGYIVHYGWASTWDWTYKSNVWINQAWCYGWVRMVVAHTTHTYGSASGAFYERICTTCGHRTSDYPFTTNISNGQVSITGASFTPPDDFTIPSVINGNPVTSIAANVFSGRSNITNLKIPKSIQTIGAGAFSGCSGLTSVTLPFVGESRIATGSTSFFGYIFGTSSYTGGTAINQNGTIYYIPTSLRDVRIIDSTSIKSNSFENCNNLRNITLPYGTTSIGAYAFSGCSQLDGFEIPRTVTSIGANAFSSCSSLPYLTVPYGVTSIGANAFPSSLWITWIYNPSCTATSLGLTSLLCEVEVQSGVQSIGSGAFTNCTNLRWVTLYENVATIASNAFTGCTLWSVEWYYNSNYTAEELGGGLTSLLTSVEVPLGMTSIKASAFNNCTNLRSVIIHENVTSAGANAFVGCTSLTSLKWYYNPNVTAAGLGIQSLLTVAQIPEDIKGTTVTSISSSAFSGCTKLTSVSWGDKVTSIGANAFNGCTALTSITIPKNITSIGENAFKDCNKMKSFRIPTKTTTIGANAFSGCDITIYAEVGSKPSGWNTSWNSSNRPVYWGISDTYFGTNSGGEYVIQSGNATLARYTGISTSFTIPATVSIGGTIYNVKKIGDSAFSGCTSLTNVSINSSVSEIGDNAFISCTGLARLTVPSSVTNIYTVSGSSINGVNFNFVPSSTMINLTLPNSIGGNTMITIGNSAFSNQTSLNELHISSSVTSIGSSAFENCTGLTTVTLSNNLTTIGSSAFRGCTSLSGIIIPSTVTQIHYNAFENCTDLTNITLLDNLIFIGNQAFKGCTSLTSISIPNSVAFIGSSVFNGCSSLTSITIPFVGQSRTAEDIDDLKFGFIFGTTPFTDGVATNQNDITYYLPSNLTTVEVTSGTNIPQDAFYNCSNLTNITIPNTVTSIGSNAFYNCPNLTNITIPNTVTSIGSNAFYGCTSLTSLTIPNSVTSLGISVLSGCSSLTRITIPFVGQSRTATGDEAKFGYIFGTSSYTGGVSTNQNDITYYLPTNLSNVTITSGTNIPQDAFYNYSWLTNITIPNTVTSIGSNAFYNCHSLTNPTIPNTVTSIGSYAFNGCFGFTSLTIPNSVTSLGSSVLSNCLGLRSITLPFVGQSRTATGNDAKFGYIFGTLSYNLGRSTYQNGITYYLPPNLSTVVITSGTNIPQDAFYNCSYLTNITIPNTVTSINSNAFYGCTKLTSFTIPSSVTSLGSNVFSGCTSLSRLLYHVVVTTSGYYNIQIANISSVTVKIDGVINYFPNNIQQKYLTAGNHTIQAESYNIATRVSFPIIASTNYIPYYIDIDNINKEFYDGPEMQYVTYPVTSTFSQGYNFDLVNRSVTFLFIVCDWELENLNYGEFHLVQMFIGENYYYENGGLYFESYDGYQTSYNTWSYSASAYNITIFFSEYEWDTYVHQL